jgi:hypothetical protein
MHPLLSYEACGSFSCVQFMQRFSKWYFAQDSFQNRPCKKCILLYMMRGTHILIGATLFTSLLACFVWLSRFQLHPPESPLSRATCGLLSIAFFFQQLHSTLAAEIALILSFQQLHGLSATEICLLLSFQQLNGTLASEISLVLLFSAAVRFFSY